MAVTCTRCPTLLVDHCPTSPTCTWMRCPNTGCDAHLFDTGRGLLQLRDNTVMSWDDE